MSSGKEAYAVCRGTVDCLIRLLRAAFLKKIGRGGPSMNYITLEKDVSAPVERPVVERSRNDMLEIERNQNLVRLAQQALSGLDARGNAAMIMAGLVCSLMEALNVEKQ